tara:strand:+ start:896 stop:1135 length:240 start_codon:yes stop_codon:yes gene_type:complete
MIDKNAKDKATQAIREARKIDDALTEQGGRTITVQIDNTPEFWAGIELLIQGEYTAIRVRNASDIETNPGYITLHRRQQ